MVSDFFGNRQPTPRRSHAIGPMVLPERCPRCGDTLKFYHTTSPGRTRHFLGCLSYPARSYTANYDDHLHQLFDLLSQRLVRCESQLAWLLVQVDVLSAQQEEGSHV